MRRTLTTSALALFLVSSACGAGATSADGSSLRDAVEKTLAADGFHIEGVLTLERADIDSEGDYVAPDRFFMESSEGTARLSTTVVVGRSYYGSEPRDAHRFTVWEMPCEVGIDTFIPAPAVVREASKIRQSDGAFTFRAEGDEGTPIEGEARVENSYLVELSIQYALPQISEQVHERWTFSDFGATVAIEPPPADQIVGESQFENEPVSGVKNGQPVDCPP